MKRIGIVAGNGDLPIIASCVAKREGYQVYLCAIVGETNPSVEKEVDKIKWVKMGELKKLSHFFIENNVKDICFEGKITKTSIFSGSIKPDLDMIMLFTKLKNRKDDTILGAICDYLEKKGLIVIDSTRFLKDILLADGLYTKKKISKNEYADIEFGWHLAKESARLDIGQSVIVKNKAVLAVEAIEGTDEAIKRGGRLGKAGSIVVKVEKPKQDMRFDVPAIGPRTIETMAEVKARVLAFEAGKTIFINKEKTVSLANKNGISIIGVSLNKKHESNLC